MTSIVDIASEVVEKFSHGNADVGTAEARLVPENQVPSEIHKGVLVRAPGTSEDTPNTDVVYIGRAGLTADVENATGGWPVPPGESVTIPILDPSQLFVISQTASQKLTYWIM